MNGINDMDILNDISNLNDSKDSPTQVTPGPDGYNSTDGILQVYRVPGQGHLRYHIQAPFYLSMTYNLSGLQNSMDSYFSISPCGKPFYNGNLSQIPHAGGNSPLHQHDYFEFLMVLKGEVIQRIEDKEYLYTAGSCCLINRNIIHTERYVGKCTVLFLALSNDFVRELVDSEKVSLFPAEDAPRQNAVFHFMEQNIHSDEQKDYLDFFPTFQNTESAQTLHDFGDKLIRTLLFPSLGSTYLLKGTICQIFSYLGSPGQYHMVPVKLHSGADFLIFLRVRSLLNDTDGRMTRTELEKVLHYSGNYLNTIVKRHTGMCLFDYGMTFTLERAKQLLETTTLSVSAIAEQLKFGNRTHFYKHFKEKYGVTPQEYRRGLAHAR